MHETFRLSELDLQLIHGLQINPRASWQHLARALNVAPSTLSRRWNALASAGHAWIATAPGPHTSWGCAYLFLKIEPGSIDAAVSHLQEQPIFATISRITGTHDLRIDCLFPHFEDLTRALAFDDAATWGLREYSVYPVTRLHREASKWRAGTLDPQAVNSIPERQESPTPPPSTAPVDLRLLEALEANARASWAQLGATCQIAPATARRRTTTLLESGALSLRCDAARSLRQGRHEVTLLLDVPPARLEQLAWHLGNLPACRVSAELIGAANLLATFWLPRLAEAHVLEQTIGRLAPGTHVVDRYLELATTKRLGWLLDDDGRTRDRVPLLVLRGA